MVRAVLVLSATQLPSSLPCSRESPGREPLLALLVKGSTTWKPEAEEGGLLSVQPCTSRGVSAPTANGP